MLGYFQAQKENLAALLRFETFAVLIPPVDRLYKTAIDLVPKEPPHLFGLCLLICHKSFLAAASLVGQAQPDDAGPITRRAIEVVRLAAAVKSDAAVFERWVAFEERMERWKVRMEGEKPKPIHINLDVKHPAVIDLMSMWGILSDADVHFTPEYFYGLDWEKRDGTMFLNYFNRDQRTIEREIVNLSGSHIRILEVLDWCLNGVFRNNENWWQEMGKLIDLGKQFAAKFERASSADSQPAKQKT